MTLPPNDPIRSSTDDVVQSRFAPHGRVTMRFEGDILFYDATGPFNIELVDSLAIAQRDILTTANHQGPWVSVSIMRNSLLASPDAFARYAAMMHAPRPPEFTPLASAYVVGPAVEGRSLMLPKYEAIHIASGRIFQSFEQLDDALAWARSLIDAETMRRATAETKASPN